VIINTVELPAYIKVGKIYTIPTKKILGYSERGRHWITLMVVIDQPINYDADYIEYIDGWNGSFHDCQYNSNNRFLFAWGRRARQAKRRFREGTKNLKFVPYDFNEKLAEAQALRRSVRGGD
jgi:hypothetical protein